MLVFRYFGVEMKADILQDKKDMNISNPLKSKFCQKVSFPCILPCISK